MKKVHLNYGFISLCGKDISERGYDFLTIGAYESLMDQFYYGLDRSKLSAAICAHCLRKYNKLKENK